MASSRCLAVVEGRALVTAARAVAVHGLWLTLVIKRAATLGTGLGIDESLQKVLPSDALPSHGEVFSVASASWMSDVPFRLHDFHYFKEPLA